MSTLFYTNSVKQSKVNKEQGELLGITLLEQGIAKGHDLLINEMTLKSFLDAIDGKPIKLFYTHQNSEALETIGAVTEVRIDGEGEEAKLVGDISLLNSFKQNDAKRYETLFELANDEELKNLIGLSAEFVNEPVYYNDKGELVTYEGQEGITEIYAKATEVMAFSIVAEPASTNGLFQVGEDGEPEEPEEAGEDMDEDEAVALWVDKLEQDIAGLKDALAQTEAKNEELAEVNCEQEKQLNTIMALAKSLQEEIINLCDEKENVNLELRKLQTELDADAPIIEPHYETDKPSLIEELKSFTSSKDRSKYVLDNLEVIWGERQRS